MAKTNFMRSRLIGAAALVLVPLNAFAQNDRTITPEEFAQSVIKNIPGTGNVTGLECTQNHVEISMDNGYWFIVGNDLGHDGDKRFINFIAMNGEAHRIIKTSLRETENGWVPTGDLPDDQRRNYEKAAVEITAGFNLNEVPSPTEVPPEDYRCALFTQQLAAH